MLSKVDKYIQNTFTGKYFTTYYLNHEVLSINSITHINSNTLNIPTITPSIKVREAMNYFIDFTN